MSAAGRHRCPMALLAMAVVLSACAGNPPASVEASTATTHHPLAEMADLPPGERYWRLAFLSGITEGVDDELQASLEARFGPPGGVVPDVPQAADYQGAGYRIASAETLADSLVDLAGFRREAGPAIDAELDAIAVEHPESLTEKDRELLAEEILLVRSAMLDSLETLAANGELVPAPDLEAYRVGTLGARNRLEYLGYARDMDALADRSIEDTQGRLDAFHRMLDDNADTAFLRERILAAEEMNRQLTDEHRRYATQRTVRTLIYLLPLLSNYYRYR